MTDGVLNTYYTKSVTSTGAIFVDDNKVKILKDIVDRTGAKVVMISTWRIGWRQIELGIRDSEFAKDFITLKNKLNEFGIELYDKTPVFNKPMILRGKEIQSYIDNSNDVIDGYVIIDDLDGKYLRPCSNHLLQTSGLKGLQEKHIKTIERILDMGM